MNAPKYGYSDRRLKRKIRGLREIFKECEQERRPGKCRFAHRDYLKCVYEVFAEIGAGAVGTQVAERLAKLYGVTVRGNAGLIRAIIDASAGNNLDAKMASRWARSLKFIWGQRQHWTDWRAFVDSHDGIAGCARALAEMRKGEGKGVIEDQEHRDLIAEKRRATMKEADRRSRIRRTSMVTAGGMPSAEPKLSFEPPTKISVNEPGPFSPRTEKTRSWPPVRWRHP